MADNPESGVMGDERTLSGWLENRIAGPDGLAEALLLLVAAAAAWVFRFVQDDAFISFRYARNMARGNGLVFNVGEPVEGYTNFLWTLIHVIPERFGWNTPVFSELLGIATMVVTVAIVLVVSRRLFASRGFALLVGLVLVANMSFLGYATGGLETMMQTMCLMGVVWALLPALMDGTQRLSAPRLLLAGGASGLAVLTRLDSVVFLAVLFVAACVVQWRADRTSPMNPVRTVLLSAVPAAVLVVPWLIWKLDYYGQLLPNTFYAKSASGPLQPVLYGLLYVLAYFISYGAFLLIGRFRKYRRSFFEVPGVAALLAVVPVWLLYICYVGADFMEYRFMVVITPLLAMLAAWLLDRFVRLRSQVLLLAVLAVFALSHQLVVNPIPFPVLSFKTINHWPTESDTTWFALGELLHENFPGGPEAEGQPTIAVAPLGVISYFADLESIDMLGLTDADVARNGDDAQMYYPGHVKMATPDYLESRGVDLVIGQPMPTRHPEQFDSYRLSQLVTIYPVTDLRELPEEAVVVELPATTTPDGVDIVWPTIYLGGNELVDEAIERNGWVTKEIVRECDPDDLPGLLQRVVATRTCPDL